MLRGVEEDAGAVPGGLRGQVPGPLHRLHLALQHRHEARLHQHLGRHRLVHAPPPAGATHLRQGAGHLPPRLPRRRSLRPRAHLQRPLHLSRDMLGVFNLPRGCGDSPSVSSTPEKQKCGQLDWTICSLSRGLPCILHSKLGLPLFHRGSPEQMDPLDCWFGPNRSLRGFLLLLFLKLEEQREARVARLSMLGSCQRRSKLYVSEVLPKLVDTIGMKRHGDVVTSFDWWTKNLLTVRIDGLYWFPWQNLLRFRS